MDGFLHFLSDLILFTAGLAVMLLWFTAFVVIAIETYDFFIGDRKLDNQSNNESEYDDA